MTKSIKILKEDGDEYYEVSLYKNNSIYSKKVVDRNGNDAELIKKEKQLALQYDSLYNRLKEMLHSNVSMNITKWYLPIQIGCIAEKDSMRVVENFQLWKL